LVPLHPTTCTILRRYARQRDAHLDPPRSPYFFVAERGGRLLHQYVYRVFWRLSRQIGLRKPSDRIGPRIHDFRHRFAVRTAKRWRKSWMRGPMRSGQPIEQLLPVLSTYLGHVCVQDTYWYLSGCPELLGEAVKRLEHRWEAAS
jgi:integrase